MDLVFTEYNDQYYLKYVHVDTSTLGVSTSISAAAMFVLSPVLAFKSDSLAARNNSRRFLLFVSLVLYCLASVPLYVPFLAGLTDENKQRWLSAFQVIRSLASTAFDLNYTGKGIVGFSAFPPETGGVLFLCAPRAWV